MVFCLFILPIYFLDDLEKRNGKFIADIHFAEINKLTWERTNWRDFNNKAYFLSGIIIGEYTEKKPHISGNLQSAFHENTAEYTFDYIGKDKQKVFLGGKGAIGKAFSLNGLQKICSGECINYFRTEAGMEVVTLKDAPHIYIFSEINKSLPILDDKLSLYANVKVQHYINNDSTREVSSGIRFHIGSTVFFLSIRKRNLKGMGPRKYDTDEDTITKQGFSIVF